METYLEDPKRQRWLIASVAFAAFVSSLDGSIVSIALPDLARDLQVPITTTSQVMVSYILFMSASLPLVGKLGSMFGAKRLFLSGFLLFGIGSLICGLSRTLDVLVAARILQSVGAAALLATGYVLVAEHLPPDRRGMAMGLLGASASVASIVGPPVGGFMTQAWGWSSIFLINVPLCVIALFFGWHYLPHDPPINEAEKSAPFDWFGLLFITLALVGINHGLNRIDLEGWSSEEGLLYLSGGVLFTWLFIRQEKRARAPIIPGAVFGDFHVILAMISVIAVMMILGCLTILGPFFLQRVHDLPPGKVGLVMTVPGLIMLLAAPISGLIADRMGPERLSALAAGLLSGSCLLMAMLNATSSVLHITVVFSLLGLSIGLFFPPNSSYVMGLATRELRSVTASTYNVFKNIGMLLGISVLGSLAYTVARSHFKGLPETPEENRLAMAIGFSAAMSGAVVLALIAAIASAFTCLRPAKSNTTTPAP
ncbi:MAG: hypothetical protein B9S32_06470 [Verrucomicrobia bacterium Tous-C9LFEB]|nr:MAG: hypothetical protein B9S32_06470 [Verrucomicrobia bacterium Tous-C9LFEB]